jgi:hypothetical protein
MSKLGKNIFLIRTTSNPSSIYSCSIGHIWEHEFCHLGCWAVKGKFLKQLNFCLSMLGLVLLQKSTEFCRSKMILDKSKLFFRTIQIHMDESKLFPTSPNCFRQVQIVPDKSKKFWTYPNGFRPVQNVLDIKDKLKCSKVVIGPV